MAGLNALVESLGSTLLDVIAAPRGLDVEVSAITVHDGADPLEAATGHIVIGVGLGPGREASSLVASLGAAGAAGLVVKRGTVADALIEDAERAGLALLAVPPGTAWA